MIPSLGIILLIFSLRWNPERKISFLLVVLSVGIGLYLIELFIYFKNQPDDVKKTKIRIAQQMGIPFDTRSTLEVVQDLKKAGIDAYPAIWSGSIIRTKGLEDGLESGSGKDKILPLAGISGKMTVLGNEGGEFSIIKSDEHGFNNPTGLYDKKKSTLC